MKYIIEIHENDEPQGVRFWATVEGLPNCPLAENTIDELYRNAPEVIKAVIETSNERGSTFAIPTGFEFRVSVPA
jgi:predicted RNase H-like HicB family nuclease